MPWRLPKALMPSLLALGLSAPALAQVYRCVDEDGTLIFSDRPCGAQAEVHESKSNFSVVPGAEDYEQRLAEDRAWIDRQREQRQSQRREHAAAAAWTATVDPAPAPAPQLVQWVPFWTPHPAPPHRPRPPHSRPERGEPGFSALSGRQLGSSRRDSDPERNQ
ncbi:MAG: DUF4124 domain-containing protein [Wenzhouxiangella sp.]